MRHQLGVVSRKPRPSPRGRGGLAAAGSAQDTNPAPPAGSLAARSASPLPHWFSRAAPHWLRAPIGGRVRRRLTPAVPEQPWGSRGGWGDRGAGGADRGEGGAAVTHTCGAEPGSAPSPTRGLSAPIGAPRGARGVTGGRGASVGRCGALWGRGLPAVGGPFGAAPFCRGAPVGDSQPGAALTQRR